MLIDEVALKCIKKINFKTEDKTKIIGITGAQGSGKTTLSNIIKLYLSKQKINCLILCIDDFYLTKSERLRLSISVHPLCRTRGVPGTHNIDLLYETLSKLSNPSSYTSLLLPLFSKSKDDTLSTNEWIKYTDKPDIIIFEGWCLGARPNFVNLNYINDLERYRDRDSVWKKWSIEKCKSYLKVWDFYDHLIMIKPTNFTSVLRSRWKQEMDNFNKTGKRLFKSYDEIIDFCSYYENWTNGMWKNLEYQTDILINRDDYYNYEFSSIYR